jgi:hypothetical protein
MLPNLSGTFGGNYSITSCTSSGFSLSSNFCGLYPVGALFPYTFNFTQAADVVSGRFFLGSVEFDNVSGTINMDGNLSFSSATSVPGEVVNVSWNLTAQRPNVLGGALANLVTNTIVAGQMNITGSISTVSKTARALPQRAVLRSFEDVIRAMRQQ